MPLARLRTTPLSLARIALGTVLLVRTTPLVNALPFPLAVVRAKVLGWPEPGWPFAWFGWVLPTSVQAGVCVVRTIAAVLFLLGIRARAAGLVAGVSGLLGLSQDPFGFVFTLHTLFLGAIVLALSDAGSDLALVPDRRWGAEDGARLVRVLVGAVYAWSAVAKAQSEWLTGATLRALAEDGLLTSAAGAFVLAHPTVTTCAAWAVFGLEAALPLGIWLPRTRTASLALAFAMHGSFELTAHPDVMGLVMASLLVGCLPAPRPPATRQVRTA